jgi:hypothetical protein
LISRRTMLSSETFWTMHKHGGDELKKSGYGPFN